MRLLTLLALGLTFGAPGRSQSVAIQPAGAPGIELIGAQSPEFQGYVQKVLGSAGFQGMMEWQPYAVALRNSSSQPVLGYRVRWAFNGGRGGRSVGEHSIYGAEAGSLQPGAIVIALPTGILTKAPSAELQSSLQQNARLLGDLEAAKTVEVSLDSAILASGQFVGPDALGQFAQDQARFTAWRGVDALIQSSVQAGDSFDAITSQLSAINSAAAAPGDWMARGRATEARQLLKLYQRSGAQAVTDLVRQHLQQPGIQIYR